jgi:hypothetical protein
MNGVPAVDRIGAIADDASSHPPVAAGETPAADAGVVRYERGSRVYATDGPVGVLRQLVVEPATGEIKALVIRLDGKRESVLTPPDLVDRSAGTALFLTITGEQFALGASRTPRFDRRQFTKANLRALKQAMRLPPAGEWRRCIGWIGRDAVQTRPAPEPAAPIAALPQDPAKRKRGFFRAAPGPSA